jgi:mannose-6-phosphate isomerase-like protein (cupin superfamily)
VLDSSLAGGGGWEGVKKIQLNMYPKQAFPTVGDFIIWGTIMPLLKRDQVLPWCELEFYEIVELPAGAAHVFERKGRKEKLIVGKGACRVKVGGEIVLAEEKANLDLSTPDGRFEVSEVISDCTLIRMCGHWGNEIGGSGIFTVSKSDAPQDKGDPVDYFKETNLDRHYHDCDEYWIVFEGSGVAVSEGQFYEVGPGDCVATGMGHHHDFPRVHAPVKAVYFETTLEGQKRRGHLWEHTHGKAQPKRERI